MFITQAIMKYLRSLGASKSGPKEKEWNPWENNSG